MSASPCCHVRQAVPPAWAGQTACPTPLERGVTLMELLVSISLLSLLSVGMLMSLRVGLNALDKADAKLMANRRVVSVERIVRSRLVATLATLICTLLKSCWARATPAARSKRTGMRLSDDRGRLV